jgi:hypothetical protein
MLGAVTSNLILVLLLVFNVFLYSRFEVHLPWRNMLSDLKWGLFLPVLVYGLNLVFPDLPLKYKVFETAILGSLLIWVVAKDNLTRIRLLKASWS